MMIVLQYSLRALGRALTAEASMTEAAWTWSLKRWISSVHHWNAENICAIPRPYAAALNDLKQQVHTDAFSPSAKLMLCNGRHSKTSFWRSNPMILCPEDSWNHLRHFKGRPRHVLENEPDGQRTMTA